MFMTKKDRKIANQEAMIKNRNDLIKDLKARNDMLNMTSKDLRFNNEEMQESLKQILNLVTSNTYNNDKIVLAKIKEVISDRKINNNF